MQNKEKLKPEMENEILRIESNGVNENSASNIRKISKKERTRKLRLAFTKMSLIAMLLIVSTYAWFTSQKDITLSNLRGTVEVAENMEISLDAKTWYQEIDLTNAETVFTAAQTSKDAAVTGTAEAILPVQLLPVSGVGEIGSTLMPLYAGKAQGLKLTNIETCAETDASGVVDNGYFAFDIYIKNTSKDGADDILQLNINSAVQVLAGSLNKTFVDIDGNNVTRTYTGDAASGLQNTVRVGIALYGKKEADGSLTGLTTSTATQEEILNTTKGINITDIAIWEPNAKDHVEYIVENNNKLINETNTNKIEFTDNQEVATYALNEDAPDEGEIANIYDISSIGLGLQRTFKTEKTSTSDYKIKTSNNKPLNIKSIQTEADGTTQKDFKITSNTVTRLRVYVWLEGQDIDCINLASQGGGIELDLGLTKDDEVGDVGTETPTPSGTLAQVTNENIGDYIDLGNNIIKTTATTDDWRIFYTDGSTVYAILADYLPANQVPAAANLNTDPTNYPYSVWSDTDRYTLLTGLTTTSYWNSFANGIEGATATGSPTKDEFWLSYNTKNSQDLSNTILRSSTEDYDLYVPHTSNVDICYGYWLASPNEDFSSEVCNVRCDGYEFSSNFGNHGYGGRPLVSLPSDIPAELVDGVWTVSN